MINQFQYDRLTGLYTKEFFYRRVREQLHRIRTRSMTCICSDIENFKLINDIFGLPAGDRLLCGIAEMYTGNWATAESAAAWAPISSPA